ncbi:MAG: phosphoglycerate kinase [Candidatus Shapirobacteria bacterium]|nr:phosphoglycerate kinase [Candidatus Shapirobacteria bacterium]MDD4383045.1 phosphoglycerate kinase [Candidatus Shapirobacteria bacterium]
MKKLNSVENINEGNVVILRMDLDLPIMDGQILDNSRLVKSIPIIKLLLERKNKIVVVGHLGRPKDRENSLSLKPIYLELLEILEADCGGDCVKNIFVDDIKDEEKIKKAISENEIIFGENLRFYKEEEDGDTTLFSTLKKYSSVYVNDAFAVAHREAASIILHREMETYYGLAFVKEVEKINLILEKKEKPMVIVLGGAKEDKLKNLKKLSKIADYILIGGKLPKFLNPSADKSASPFDKRETNIVVAGLREDGLDLSDEDIRKFKKIINEAKTIVWAGAMGFYEDKNCRKGTEEIAWAIAECKGYKVIAGGDTAASIVNLGLGNKIDFVCSGGGVILDFLIKGSLPAWE